jgi:hypothetical protein
MRPAALLCALLACALHAQDPVKVVGPSPATVFADERGQYPYSRVDLVVDGRLPEPDAPRIPRVDGLQVRILGPSREQAIHIVNGAMRQTNTVTWQLVLQPLREGRFTIPAFAWKVGDKEQQVGPITVEALKELRGAEFSYLDVQVQPLRVYVHEPVRARIEFGIDTKLTPVQGRTSANELVFDSEIQASWLSGKEGFEPLAEDPPTGDYQRIILNQTHVQAADYDGAHERGGRQYRSFTFDKGLLPVRPGKYVLDAPVLRYDIEVGPGGTDFFGNRVGRTQNYYVHGKPVEIEVLPIPEQGRPSPYYGAVGRFEIDASADRDRVKVGDSVKVAFTIRGRGNLEFLRVPELESFEALGLHKLAKTRARQKDAVVVTYDLTPLRTDVTGIPAIAWNWFDTTPGVEKFVSASTKPLPLAVQARPDGETLAPMHDEARKAVVKGVDDIFDLPDLGGPPVRRPGPGAAAAWLCVLGPWLLAAAAAASLAFVRRRGRDPLAARARRAARDCEGALAAGVEPAAAFAEYLGARLRVPAAAVIAHELPQRLRAAGIDGELLDAAVAAIEQGTAARYGGGGGLDAAAVRALVLRFEGTAVRPVAAARALLFAVLVGAACGAVRAQEDAAVAAYRKGDYAGAERAFAERFERTGDRRLWFARGNCFFREGDLPRAVWAFECARLGLPRDPELLANLALARQKVDLGAGSQPFVDALVQLRERFTAGELALLAAAAMTVAAFALCFLWRRPAARWIGFLALAPGLLLAAELLWLAPARAPAAIALGKLELTSEPRTGLRPVATVATVAAGQRLELRSAGDGDQVLVEADGRIGYARRELVGRIE